MQKKIRKGGAGGPSEKYIEVVTYRLKWLIFSVHGDD